MAGADARRRSGRPAAAAAQASDEHGCPRETSVLGRSGPLCLSWGVSFREDPACSATGHRRRSGLSDSSSSASASPRRPSGVRTTCSSPLAGGGDATLVTDPGVLEPGGDPVDGHGARPDNGPVVLAVGRDTDVEGWVGTDAHDPRHGPVLRVAPAGRRGVERASPSASPSPSDAPLGGASAPAAATPPRTPSSGDADGARRSPGPRRLRHVGRGVLRRAGTTDAHWHGQPGRWSLLVAVSPESAARADRCRSRGRGSYDAVALAVRRRRCAARRWPPSCSRVRRRRHRGPRAATTAALAAGPHRRRRRSSRARARLRAAAVRADVRDGGCGRAPVAACTRRRMPGEAARRRRAGPRPRLAAVAATGRRPAPPPPAAGDQPPARPSSTRRCGASPSDQVQRAGVGPRPSPDRRRCARATRPLRAVRRGSVSAMPGPASPAGADRHPRPPSTRRGRPGTGPIPVRRSRRAPRCRTGRAAPGAPARGRDAPAARHWGIPRAAPGAAGTPRAATGSRRGAQPSTARRPPAPDGRRRTAVRAAPTRRGRTPRTARPGSTSLPRRHPPPTAAAPHAAGGNQSDDQAGSRGDAWRRAWGLPPLEQDGIQDTTREEGR